MTTIPVVDATTTSVDRQTHTGRVDALRVGDQVFTPAYRWETVTRLDQGDRYSRATRVFTDHTGPEYAWRLANHHTLPILPASLVSAVPSVRVEASRDRVVAFVGADERPSATVLAEAVYLGRGNGWRVNDRPNGLDLVTSVVARKDLALSRVRRAARAHAKALGLRVCAVGGGSR